MFEARKSVFTINHIKDRKNVLKGEPISYVRIQKTEKKEKKNHMKNNYKNRERKTTITKNHKETNKIEQDESHIKRE